MKTEKHGSNVGATKDEPVVSSVGVGEDTRKVVRVGAWELTAWTMAGEDEPRIRDVDLGKRLGYERPRKIRDLIDRLIKEKKLNDIHQRPTVGRRPGQVAAQTVDEYWLTQSQALKVAAKSETEPADALL